MDRAPLCTTFTPASNYVLSTSITCPFCGLLCDDLDATDTRSGCNRYKELRLVRTHTPCQIQGKTVGREEAIHAAASILHTARRPLISGLGCDVAGHRAALDLAEHVDAKIDHMHGASLFRNMLAFQDGGWVTTTLSELRNRADVIVMVGTVAAKYPRFFERCVAPESQFGELVRRIIVLGKNLSSVPGHSKEPDLAIPVPCPRLGEFFAALRSRLMGNSLSAPTVSGIPVPQLDELLTVMRNARYGVLVWDASELDFPGAELAIQTMLDLVKDLNKETRWAGLPLGGNNGGTSATQVCTWRTGYPLRIGFEANGPHYEPLLFSTERLLAGREVDALLWISALEPERVLPDTTCHSIVLGRPDMTFPKPPDVFIPVGVPGINHAGCLHRMDGVLALPLSAIDPSPLPSVADTLLAIQQELSRAEA